MAERKVEPVKFDGETLYIEVTDIEQTRPGPDDYEYTKADELVNAGEQVRTTIKLLANTVYQALSETRPAEWMVEINVGFKGKAGIPFVTEGEAHGAVKVSAKWKRD